MLFHTRHVLAIPIFIKIFVLEAFILQQQRSDGIQWYGIRVDGGGRRSDDKKGWYRFSQSLVNRHAVTNDYRRMYSKKDKDSDGSGSPYMEEHGTCSGETVFSIARSANNIRREHHHPKRWNRSIKTKRLTSNESYVRRGRQRISSVGCVHDDVDDDEEDANFHEDYINFCDEFRSGKRSCCSPLDFSKVLRATTTTSSQHVNNNNLNHERESSMGSSVKDGIDDDDDGDDDIYDYDSAVVVDSRRMRDTYISATFQEPAASARVPVIDGTSNALWPPWPFNLLTRPRPRHNNEAVDPNSPQSTRRNTWRFLGTLTKQSIRASWRRAQYFSSQLLFHLPPAAHPLLVVAAIPRRRPLKAIVDNIQQSTEQGTATVYETFVPLFSNPFVLNLALSSVGLALLSWAHYQIHRKRLLTRLPLGAPYRDLNFAVLPPFLPEKVLHDQQDDIWMIQRKSRKRQQQQNSSDTLDDNEDGEDEEEDDDDDDEDKVQQLSQAESSRLLPRRLRGNWNAFWGRNNASSASEDGRQQQSLWTVSSAWSDWRRASRARRRDRHNARRIALMEELIALQTLKESAVKQQQKYQKRQYRKRQRNARVKRDIGNNDSITNRGNEPLPLGYAVVTGASRGIGRAVAVELARWEIPLVLVARDIDQLTELAFDLKACYGVPCCVIQADLTQPDAPEKLYNAIHKAGIHVDILVNNAGISSQGLSVDLPLHKVNDMINLNVQAVSTLTHLFGKDMKDRRRGRILMVSSICGAVAGIPSVSVYSATKAFEKTLALSLAKEMEKFGVGVTVILPGAVRGTEFRSRSNSQQALCWKVPFYPMSPQKVAHIGVRAMLLGESEVTPGWSNRAFTRVLQPALPQRIHNIVAGIMWSPFSFPSLLGWRDAGVSPDSNITQIMSTTLGEDEDDKQDDPALDPLKLRQKFEKPPRLLQLEENTSSAQDDTSNAESSTLKVDNVDDEKEVGKGPSLNTEDVSESELPETRSEETVNTTTSADMPESQVSDKKHGKVKESSPVSS